jgi:hypothetical protein
MTIFGEKETDSRLPLTYTRTVTSSTVCTQLPSLLEIVCPAGIVTEAETDGEVAGTPIAPATCPASELGAAVAVPAAWRCTARDPPSRPPSWAAPS